MPNWKADFSAPRSPTVKLTDEQKKMIAELESKCTAKVAERELFLKGEIAKAIDKGDAEAVAAIGEATPQRPQIAAGRVRGEEGESAQLQASELHGCIGYMVTKARPV